MGVLAGRFRKRWKGWDLSGGTEVRRSRAFPAGSGPWQQAFDDPVMQGQRLPMFCKKAVLAAIDWRRSPAQRRPKLPTASTGQPASKSGD